MRERGIMEYFFQGERYLAAEFLQSFVIYSGDHH